MTLKEKILYHQIHPLKLIADWGTGILALYLFWRNNILPALLLASIPSSIVSVIVIRFADLKKYQQSRIGRYICQFMTRPLEIIRLAGYVLMALGAWYHVLWPIAAGFLAITLAWLRGVLFPGFHAAASHPGDEDES
jgi:hypothetical protein